MRDPAAVIENRPRQDGVFRYHKPVVGLAGGIGAGKSSVARIMGELGAGVIESDQLGRIEIDSPGVKETISRWWGQRIIAGDGTVDRRKVASIVFRDALQRHRLEALLHPRIAIRRADKMAEIDAQPRFKMIVIDTPLLYETDLDLTCDAVVFVESEIGIRKARSEKLRHWSPRELVRREKAQQSLDMKRARADYVCENNSTLADLREQVERITTQILSEFGTA